MCTVWKSSESVAANFSTLKGNMTLDANGSEASTTIHGCLFRHDGTPSHIPSTWKAKCGGKNGSRWQEHQQGHELTLNANRKLTQLGTGNKNSMICCYTKQPLGPPTVQYTYPVWCTWEGVLSDTCTCVHGGLVWHMYMYTGRGRKWCSGGDWLENYPSHCHQHIQYLHVHVAVPTALENWPEQQWETT